MDRFDALSTMYSHDKSLTPVTMLDNSGDWDSSSSTHSSLGGFRKRGYGPQQQPTQLEVLRNDRTPLNTPYTPQLVKLHLKRHDEYEQQQHESEQARTPVARQFVSRLKSKLLVLAHPVQRIRCIVDKALELVLPNAVLRSRLFIHNRWWILWYLTTVISIPFALLLSPMVIALCICTSPIWLAGVAVLLVRALMPAWHPAPIADAYVRKASPAGKRANSSNGAHRRPHVVRDSESTSHPNSMYRHAHLTSLDPDHDG